MIKYQIRRATEDDAQAVHDIYGAIVPSDHVTFTVENPSVEAYRQKINKTKENYPFLVAEDEGGRILGYVCGSELRPHDAYRWNVEWTIVLSPDTPRRQGIGTALYRRFADLLTRQGYRYIYGVIVDTNHESLMFHEKLGFVEVGHFENAGYKHGAWRGITWMVKKIGTDGDPVEPLPLSSVCDV